MANPTNFEDIMNMNIDDIEDIPLTPKGTYLVMVKGMPEQGTSSQQQTPFWRYKFSAIEAMDDLGDEGRQLLRDIGGVQALELQHDFYITDKAVPMFRNFLKNALGISGIGLKEAIPESVGKQCKIHVSHRPQRNSRPGQEVRLRAEIDDFAAA
jgi:hypothetical protein